MTPAVIAAQLSWEVLLPLITKHGLPWVIDLLGIILRHPQPTEAVIPELRALSGKTMDDYLREAAERLNLPAPPTT